MCCKKKYEGDLCIVHISSSVSFSPHGLFYRKKDTSRILAGAPRVKFGTVLDAGTLACDHLASCALQDWSGILSRATVIAQCTSGIKAEPVHMVKYGMARNADTLACDHLASCVLQD
jgi:hypothetical protein